MDVKVWGNRSRKMYKKEEADDRRRKRKVADQWKMRCITMR